MGKYTPSPECAKACAALGYYNNMPADYCENTDVWTTVAACSHAAPTLEEIKNNALYSTWCDPDKSVSVSNGVPNYFKQKPKRDDITTEQLKNCADSYKQQCYNQTKGQKSKARRAFDQCCDNCFEAISS